MKSDRHAEILKIIENNSIETQDELLGKLKAAGFKATQATISRDIKDLRLVQMPSPAPFGRQSGNWNSGIPESMSV